MILRFPLRAAAAAVLVCLAAPALAQQTAVVATHVIYPGQTVTFDALEEVPLRRKLDNVTAIALTPDEVEGKVARRTLLPGRLIPISSVREPYLVEAGAPVHVMLVQGALTISLSGMPLQPGAVGDLIKVRNLDSGAVFMGTVMADGTIRVGAT
jgi:flagella basal body P-ring formation protein FlgA